MGFPGSSAGKESTCNAGDLGLIPGWGRYPGEGIGYPFQYSWDSPGGSAGKESLLQCRGPGFDPWVGKICWRREKLPTPVFWPGEFHGLWNSPWGCKESDMTEQLRLHVYYFSYDYFWLFIIILVVVFLSPVFCVPFADFPCVCYLWDCSQCGLHFGNDFVFLFFPRCCYSWWCVSRLH